jgi:organic hydroperoxide reductase OsmC/OhrA
MPDKTHAYAVTVRWTGNEGSGTSTHRTYSRDHEIQADGKPVIAGSSGPSFRGDRTRWNPEELLLASLSACHKLWYLGLCAEAGVVVTAYEDAAEGRMVEEPGGGGQFAKAILRPRVIISSASDTGKAQSLHAKAHEMCFIARSVNFPVVCEPTVIKES